MKLQDIKEDKSLWEKMNIEGVGKVLLVEESYYDGIVECVGKLEETKRPSPSFVSTDFILEFDRLKEENERLKEAMRQIIEAYEYGQPDHNGEVMAEVEDTCDAMFNIASLAIR